MKELLDLLTNIAKSEGYLDARIQLREFLNEIESAKLISHQMKTYILDGMEAKWNVYHNSLTNENKGN